MSGPKVIVYKMDAFDGRLNDFMRKQAQLTQMCIQMREAEISDENLNIHFNCKESYDKIKAEVEKALTSMVFDYTGTIDKKTYDSIDKQIKERTDKLNEIIKKSDTILSDYNSKQKDYKSFIDYNLFVKNAQASLEKFKLDTNENLETNFAKQNAALVEEAKKKYGTVAYEKTSKEFSWGFDKIADKEKNVVVNHLIEKENIIRDIRQGLLDKVITTDTKQKITTAPKKKTIKPSEEINNICLKIEMLINNCNEKVISSGYSKQFNKLKQSESMNDLFFYQELHDRILENESTRNFKLSINDIIANLNSSNIDGSLSQDKKLLLQKAISLLNNSRISEKEVSDLKKENELFFKKNKKAAEDIAIKKKEQLFLKSQIILNFENLGYEVMDDLKVIDFEKENDFYLKAPGQENLLNIKFKEDGSFRYVFQIPEKKEDLSVDAQNMKIHEMKTTCGDFVNILSDLKKMGVSIDIKSEKPIELNSMITIPESVSAKIKTTQTQTQRKQQIKKLYLD